MLHLMGGDNEPLADLPVMPGEIRDTRPIMIDTKNLTVELETELNAIRDEVLDQIVIRKRLEKYLSFREDGDQWDEIAKLLEQFEQLPTKASFNERVTKLRDDASKKQNAGKKPIAILTRNAQKMISDTSAMIDGYLDDEIFKAFAEALAKRQTNPPGANAKSSISRANVPPPTAPAQPPLAQAAPATPQVPAGPATTAPPPASKGKAPARGGAGAPF